MANEKTVLPIGAHPWAGRAQQAPQQGREVGLSKALVQEIRKTEAFQKRRVEELGSTSRGYKRAMVQAAAQEAEAVLRAASRLEVGMGSSEATDLVGVTPEKWDATIIDNFYEGLTLRGIK